MIIDVTRNPFCYVRIREGLSCVVIGGLYRSRVPFHGLSGRDRIEPDTWKEL